MSPRRHSSIEIPVYRGFAQLPDGGPREQIFEIQRARIVAAMVDVASGMGAGNATVARVVARSGISRRTFYEIFEDREDCFLAAFVETVERVASIVVPAYEAPRAWHVKMRAGLAATLELFDHDRETARLVVVEALGAGPNALERRRQVLDQLIAAVDSGRSESRKSEDLMPLAAEGVVGGALSLIYTRLLENGETKLVDLLNPLMSLIVLPYLGPAAARRELTQAAPKSVKGARKVRMDPLRDLEMRLTYRTVRVLLAIHEHPGASNRQIGDASGVRDQGQISKLLARLEHLGLIRNAARAQPKSESNRWALTERGGEVRAAISAQSALP